MGKKKGTFAECHLDEQVLEDLLISAEEPIAIFPTRLIRNVGDLQRISKLKEMFSRPLSTGASWEIELTR